MIAVCEPQCIGFAHEIVNSGFLLNLKKIYPNRTIFFYGEKEHIRAIQYCFFESGNSLEGIEFFPVTLPPQRNTFLDVPANLIFWGKILSELKQRKVDQLFLLSAHGTSLLALKLFRATAFRNMEFIVLLHGFAEYVQHSLMWCLGKSRAIRWIQHARYILKYRNNGFVYVALSLFCFNNMKSNSFFNRLPLEWIYLPTIISQDTPILAERTVHIAVVGAGNTLRVYELDKILTNSGHKNYRIYVLGNTIDASMCSERVTSGDKAGRITRKSLSEYMKNIDILLYLYDERQYTFTQSGAFYEAFQYFKPVIFLKNKNFSFHNTIKMPFGVEVESVAAMANMLEMIMDGNAEVRQQFIKLKQNIPFVRGKIENESICKVREISGR